MTLTILDSGAVSRLSLQKQQSKESLAFFQKSDFWPLIVPSVVLVECLSGRQNRDAVVHRVLKTCEIVERLSERVARRAGELRFLAQRGEVVDAVVVAMAEPGGIVLTVDIKDLSALADHASGVTVHHADKPRR